MSDSTPFGFGKLVPGFEFLQNLAQSAVKGASQGLPHMPSLSHWVAPTMNVEELEKRIEELKAVQFWLDQNSRALSATVQALEVQKMTLATLKGMNFSMGDLAESFKLKTADVMANVQKASDTFTGAARAAASAAGPTPAPPPEPTPAPEAAPPAPEAAAPAADAEAARPGVVDPLQWWGALTQQFQHIASSALKDAASASALDGSHQLAREAFKTAAETVAKTVGAGLEAAKAGTRAAAPKAAKAAPKAAAKAAAKKPAAPAAKKAPAKKAATKAPARRSSR
ncbi:hypothetical protein PSQ20_14885 [Curvibacter sp. RS43]|uniref:PhaM family polyhydroxyalkanoate granule multifunctional regulatory protein n=1 Tax=Curvibacter microcysteis TaxID=3026419 RepID=UPI00235FB623|nr:PhaM family polyhydroxyalkanoate granule multifunctional regulatory protein [Curvibacter sp. RS43]MDD0811640.1 hypothetical protein [Curvibacter sp. RS43]